MHPQDSLTGESSLQQLCFMVPHTQGCAFILPITADAPSTQLNWWEHIAANAICSGRKPFRHRFYLTCQVQTNAPSQPENHTISSWQLNWWEHSQPQSQQMHPQDSLTGESSLQQLCFMVPHTCAFILQSQQVHPQDSLTGESTLQQMQFAAKENHLDIDYISPVRYKQMHPHDIGCWEHIATHTICTKEWGINDPSPCNCK